MWLIELALRRPYTFAVLAIVILLGGGLAAKQVQKDIFPNIEIPVISVIWTYPGLGAFDFERRITQYSENSISANVNDVERIESQTTEGVGLIRIYFHPGAKSEVALAQATAISQTIQRIMPPGVTPPIMVRYRADSVPLIQLALSSDSMSEAQIFDYANTRIRPSIASVQGITMPAPYGGAARLINVDIDPAALRARGLSARDVSEAVGLQNLTLPAGAAKIGDTQYAVQLNSSPLLLQQLNDLPVREVGGSMVYLRDVAQVRDGQEPQINIVRVDGQRSVLIHILKNGNASTLDIVEGVKALLPSIQAAAPEGMKIEARFDQSTFVSGAMEHVAIEGLIAATLTATFILLFLGSWRSTLIVAVSIPLSILSSIALLTAFGHTLNLMTLGGLALAIGILVDEATITIENIHRHRNMIIDGRGKDLYDAILIGSTEIAFPALVSALVLTIVFVPVWLLGGVARYLFIPLALAVVFAILSSYVLSRTLTPAMANWLLRHEPHEDEHAPPKNGFDRIHKGFNRGFENLRSRYARALQWNLAHRGTALAAMILVVVCTSAVLPFVGREFFPTVDAGQIRMHVRAPTGTRIERTEQIFSAVEQEVRTLLGRDVALILDNIGQPAVKYSMAFGDSVTVGTHDGEVLIALAHDRQRGAPEWMQVLRTELPKKFPDLDFYFQPADIVSQILNFGLPAQINVKVVGFKRIENFALAQQLKQKIAAIPGAVDVTVHQTNDLPTLKVDVDRQRALQLGITQRDVANDLLVTLSGSGSVTPNFWMDPATGNPYRIAVQLPEREMSSVESLVGTPVSVTGGTTQLLGNLGTVSRATGPSVISHYNVQPSYDLFVSVHGRDLGAVAADLDKVLDEARKQLQPGNRIELRGTVTAMRDAFSQLGFGLLGAAVLVYLLMVVNFQSWRDPFIVLMALPAAGAGVIWGLWLTGTFFSVPALMGAIMTIGLATANSILLVTFANQRMDEGLDSFAAALDAGSTRLRPVLMTAGAMLIGMVPMALGMGDGGEQNAPLGRAVIGGLSFATFGTLLFVPVVYATLRRGVRADPAAASFAAQHSTH
ncbi:MAG: efflux RND transporter permease subunit [Stagnimonas sp.]|nr:efflux RND transporter permease subunit [Stagnimonas sp.]